MEDGAGQVSFMGHHTLPLRLAGGALVGFTRFFRRPQSQSGTSLFCGGEKNLWQEEEVVSVASQSEREEPLPAYYRAQSSSKLFDIKS